MYNKINSKYGFTLLELILAMAIGIIVLAGAFSVFLFGSKTFNYGSTQRNIQADLRLAADVIRDEIRYATDLGVLSTFNESTDIENSKNYIYLSADQKSIMVYHSGTSPREIVNFDGTGILMSAEFTRGSTVDGVAISYSNTVVGTSSEQNTLQYRLSGASVSNNKSYEVKSEVIMLNTKSVMAAPLGEVPPPNADPETGTYLIAQTVELIYDSDTTTAYYSTTNAPGSYNIYTSSISVPTSMTIWVYSVRNSDGEVSPTVELDYVINPHMLDPIASNVKILPTTVNGTVGQVLEVKYDFTSPVQAMGQGATIIEWRSYDKDIDKFTGYTVIKNDTFPTDYKYTVQSADWKKNIYVVITPKDNSSVTGQDAVSANSIYIKDKK